MIMNTTTRRLTNSINVTRVLSTRIVRIMRTATSQRIFTPPIDVTLGNGTTPKVSFTSAVETTTRQQLMATTANRVTNFPPVLKRRQRHHSIRQRNAIFITFRIRARRRQQLSRRFFSINRLHTVTRTTLNRRRIRNMARILNNSQLTVNRAHFQIRMGARQRTIFKTLSLLHRRTMRHMKLILKALDRQQVRRAVSLIGTSTFICVEGSIVRIASLSYKTTRNTTLKHLQVNMNRIARTNEVFHQFTVRNRYVLQYYVRAGNTRRRNHNDR